MYRKKWISALILAAVMLSGCSAQEKFTTIETVSDDMRPETDDTAEKGSIMEQEKEEIAMENGSMEETAPEGTKPVPQSSDTDYAFIEMESMEQNPELPTGC